MGLADFNFKGIEEIKAKVKNLNIGLNKDERKLKIDSLDQSAQIHFRSEIGLTPEAILKLSAEDIGNYIKQQTLLNLKAAYIDKPQEFLKLVATYSTTALATGASYVIGNETINQSSYTKVPLMPSGDFINGIPEAIEKALKDEMSKFQNYGLGE